MTTGVAYMMQSTLENDLWLGRFKDGDEKALAYVHLHTYQALVRYGSRYLSDPFEVQSIVQEAFLKAWELKDRMESLRHIYCFLRKAICWYCYAWLKSPRNAFYRKQVYHTGDTEAYEQGASTHALEGAEQAALLKEERLSVIAGALAYLPPTRKNMLELHYQKGLSCKAIAGRYGSSTPFVHREVHKAVQYLQQVLHCTKKPTTLKP